MDMITDAHKHVEKKSCSHIFTSANMQICRTQSHADTGTQTQNHVTDSTGALSTVDNWYHYCGAFNGLVT